MGAVHPYSMGSPRSTSWTPPLRHIVSSRGSVTYGVAKVLTKTLKPLIGRSPHQICSTQDFVEKANKETLIPGECFSFSDVTALFTSVPLEPVLGIIQGSIGKRQYPKERTVLLVKDIILLLEFCLKNTYLSFQHQFYEQVEGAAMGSLVHPSSQPLYGVLWTKSSKHCHPSL